MSQETVNPDPSCEDDYDPNSMPVHIARQRIEMALSRVSTVERVALRMALGRVLAAPISARFDVPPHSNSARDGFALRSADVVADGETTLTLVGASLAGHPFAGTVEQGQIIRIMTGAAMPDGGDTVAMQEHCTVDGNQITLANGAARTSHIRHPGEDLKQGDEVLQPGHLLRPADLGVIASLGIAEVSVYRKLRVAFFSTGDELRSLGEPLGHGDIYDSNRYTVHGMLERLGVEIIDLGVVRDREEDVRMAFADASAAADVVISTGGVSVGDADYVTDTLAALGTVNFWKIAMKPGRPLTFGQIGDAMFFGLPGNPVSVMVTFYEFVQPALRQMMGCTRTMPPTVWAPLAHAITNKQPGRLEYQRAVLAQDADGALSVGSTGAQGSHILNSMSHANCFIVLPMDCAGLKTGELVEVQPFEGII